MSVDRNNFLVELHLCFDGTRKGFLKMEINPDSELHQLLLQGKACIDKHQFVRDCEKKLLVVYNSHSEDGSQTTNFYCVESRRTIVRVKSANLHYIRSGLRLYKEDWCVFDGFSCIIDFNAARNLPQPIDLSADDEVDYDEKSILDSKTWASQKVEAFNNPQLSYKHPFTSDDPHPDGIQTNVCYPMYMAAKMLPAKTRVKNQIRSTPDTDIFDWVNIEKNKSGFAHRTSRGTVEFYAEDDEAQKWYIMEPAAEKFVYF